MFKLVRITVLLCIFVALAFYTKTQRLKSRTWAEPLEVVLYPMNSDHSPIVADYIKQLEPSIFKEIDQFFMEEAKHYELINENPIKTSLGSILQTFPPAAPSAPFNILEAIWWSIKFRYWAYIHTPDSQSNLHRVRIFVHYHEAIAGQPLQHSLGLNKGLLSIVHLFASKDQDQQNNIIIAHELLHTVGATDKYDRYNQPIFPDGYAEPNKQPLFPQDQAEIMSAKIPYSKSSSEMAESLDQCLIGEKTAREVNWVQSDP